MTSECDKGAGFSVTLLEVGTVLEAVLRREEHGSSWFSFLVVFLYLLSVVFPVYSEGFIVVVFSGV